MALQHSLRGMDLAELCVLEVDFKLLEVSSLHYLTITLEPILILNITLKKGLMSSLS